MWKEGGTAFKRAGGEKKKKELVGKETFIPEGEQVRTCLTLI